MSGTSTASDALSEAQGYDRERAEMLFDLYKILLADDWHEMDEQDRRNHIRRMMFAVYGAYNEPEVFQVYDAVTETDIYKYVEQEGLLDELASE